MKRKKAGKFINAIGTGATRPFIVEDDVNLKWVVKVIGNPFGAQAVFNELIAGKLARQIGLPWPAVSIIELSPALVDTLAEIDFKVISNVSVGTEYISGLMPVEFPEDFDIADKTKNATYIRKLFNNDNLLDCFYGKSLFDNWVLILNDTKYDTLQISHDGKPIFLDATFAFGYFNIDWEDGKLAWRNTAINLEMSPYLCGIVTDVNKYKYWLEKISIVSIQGIDDIIDSVPKEWAVPDRYLNSLRKFIRSTPDVFVPLINDYLDYLKYVG